MERGARDRWVVTSRWARARVDAAWRVGSRAVGSAHGLEYSRVFEIVAA
jgi:hypothetical protein